MPDSFGSLGDILGFADRRYGRRRPWGVKLLAGGPGSSSSQSRESHRLSSEKIVMPNSIHPKERRLRVTTPSSARIEVTFTVKCPEAREVFLCGDFNDWSPSSLRMIHRNPNGLWEKRLALAPGRYEYKFVVDGEWIHDPHADQNVPNPGGSLNSVIDVRM